MEPVPPPTSPLNVAQAFATREAARKNRRPDIHLSDGTATLFVALTTLIFCFSFLVPVLPILVFYLLWFTQPLLKGWRVVLISRTTIWVMALPVLGMVSVLWSAYPGHTLYLSVAMLSTVIGVLILNEVVRLRALLDGLIIGITVALIITLASHIYGTDAFGDTYSLVGYFGSKNKVGEIAEVGVVCSVATLFMQGGMLRRMVLSVGPLAVCILCLFLCKSATSSVSLIVALMAMGWIVMIVRLPRTLRHIAILVTLLGVFLIGASGVAMNGSDVVLKTFGKDATLTGRTYLWQQGYQIGMERPLLGHGYSAFWVQGEPRAERYWQEFGMASRTGFHFHDMYVQAFVDLGIIGVLIVALQILLVCYEAVRRGLSDVPRSEAAFWMGISFMFLIRSAVEVDYINPFDFGTFIVYSAILRLARRDFSQ